jgi:hypothetical protein
MTRGYADQAPVSTSGCMATAYCQTMVQKISLSGVSSRREGGHGGGRSIRTLTLQLMAGSARRGVGRAGESVTSSQPTPRGTVTDDAWPTMTDSCIRRANFADLLRPNCIGPVAVGLSPRAPEGLRHGSRQL